MTRTFVNYHLKSFYCSLAINYVIALILVFINSEKDAKTRAHREQVPHLNMVTRAAISEGLAGSDATVIFNCTIMGSMSCVKSQSLLTVLRS